MNTYNIKITEPAENDLYEIGNYISKELLDPKAAKRLIFKIAEAIGTLEDMPLRNSLVADNKLAYKGLRKIIVENYIVFYIVKEQSKTVIIVRILHNRRNWISLL